MDEKVLLQTTYTVQYYIYSKPHYYEYYYYHFLGLTSTERQPFEFELRLKSLTVKIISILRTMQ